MKKILTILVLILSTVSIYARNDERSVLEVRLNDHSPLIVVIDGRDYNKYGRTITIGNLPKGWHNIKVYQYKEYKDGGGRAKTIYSGRLRIDAGTVTRCVVDVQNNRMRINSMDIEDAYVEYDRLENNDHYENNNNQLLNDDLKDLQARVEERISDSEKLKLMKSVLEGRTYYSVQVRTMLDWLAFEGSRLDFAKWSYDRIIDKKDYWKLEDVFTFIASKHEYNKYIKSH